MSVGENLENQALFERFSEAIATVLGENVAAALASGCPAWLNEFIRVAYQRRATLVTFNYDLLIECAVATGLAWPRSSGRADRILARDFGALPDEVWTCGRVRGAFGCGCCQFPVTPA